MRGRKPKKNTKDKTESPVRNTPKRRYKRSTISSSDPSDDGTHQPRKNILTSSDIKAFFKSLKGKKRTQLPIFRNPIQKSTFSDYYSSSEQHSSTEDDDSSYSYYYEEEEEENSDPFSVLTQVAPETESEHDEDIPANTNQGEILNIPESNTEISQQINQQSISEGKSDINVSQNETISDLQDQKQDITQQSKQSNILELNTENQAPNQHSSSYEYTYTYSSEEESKIKSENIEFVNDTKNQEITTPDESQNQIDTMKLPQTINESQDLKPLNSSPQDVYEEDLNKPELVENSNLKQEDSDQYSYYYTYSSEANEETKISPLQDEEQKQQKTILIPSEKIENLPKPSENVIEQKITPLIEDNIKEKQEISSKKEILTNDQINLPEKQINDSKTTVEGNVSSEYSYYYTYSSEAETNATEIKQNIIESSHADTKPQSVEETKKLQSESEYSYYYTYSEEENLSQTVPKKPVEKKLTQGKLHIDETEDHKYLQVSVTKSDSLSTHKQFTHKMKQQPIKKLSQMKIEKFLSPTKTSKNIDSSEYEYYYTYSETDTETKEPTLNPHEIETQPEESDNNKSSIVASLIQSTKSKPKTEFQIPIIKKETITPKQKLQTKKAQAKPQVTDESSSSYYYYYSEEEVIIKPSEVKTSKPILEILTEKRATKSNTKQVSEKPKQNEIQSVVDSSMKSSSYYSSELEIPTKSIVENDKTEETKQSSSEYYYSYSEEGHPKASVEQNINKSDESYYYSSEEEIVIKKESKQETEQPQSESYYYSSAEEQSIKKINDDKVEKLKFSSDQEQPAKTEIKTAVKEEFKQELPQTDSYYSSDDENIKKYLKKDAWANTKVKINAFESDSYYYYSSQEEVQIKKYNIPEPHKHQSYLEAEVNKNITTAKAEQSEQKPIQMTPQASNRVDDSESYYYSTEEETTIQKEIRYKIPHSESTYSEENPSKVNTDQNINGIVEPIDVQEATTVAEEKANSQEKSTSKEIIGKVVSPDSKETSHEVQESGSYYYSYSSDNESALKPAIEQHPHENKNVNSESSYYYSSEEDMPPKQQTSNDATIIPKSEIQNKIITTSDSVIQTTSSNTNIESKDLKQDESESYYYSSEEEKSTTTVKQNNQSLNGTNVPNPATKTKEGDSYYYSSEEEIKPKTTPNNQTSKTTANNLQNDKHVANAPTKLKEESSSSYYSSEEETKIRPPSNAIIVQIPIVNKQQNSLIATKDDSNYYSSEEEKPSKAAPKTPEIKKQVLQTPDNNKQPKISEPQSSAIQTPVAKSNLSPEQSQKLSQLDKQNKVDPYLSPNQRKLFNKSKLKKFETPKNSSVRYINAYANSDYSSAPPSAFQSPYAKSPAKKQLWSSLRPKEVQNETPKVVPNESPKPSPKPKQHENQNEQIHRRNKWPPHTKPNHKPNERRKFNQQNYTNRKPFNFDKYNK